MDNQNLNFNLNAKNYQPKYDSYQQNQNINQQYDQKQYYQQNYYQQQQQPYYQQNYQQSYQQNPNYYGNNDQYSNYYNGNTQNYSNYQQQNYNQNYYQQNNNQSQYNQGYQVDKQPNNKYNQSYYNDRSTVQQQQQTNTTNKPYEVEVIQDSSNNYQGGYNKRGRGKGSRGRGGYNKGNQYRGQNQNQYQDNTSQSTNNYSISHESKGYSNFEEFEKYDQGHDEYPQNGEFDNEINDVYAEEFEHFGEEDLLNDDKYVEHDDYQADDLGYEFQEKVNMRGTKYSEPQSDLIFSNKFGLTDYVNKTLNKSKKFPTDSFVNVLMIAEKPSIAQAIAFAIGKGNANNNQRKGLKTFQFDGFFKDIRARFTVTSVMGHVMTTDFQRKHNNWDSIDQLELFDVDIIKQDANPKARLGNHLRSVAKGKDIICLWLDCDKEGENICYETLYYTYPYMNKKNYQQIYRAKFSSLTNQDLKSAFNNICDLPNANESLSVDARQLIDLKIGVAFTRFLTTNIFPLIKNIDDPNLKLLSYGPCQTPTLYFCVKRHYEIEKFQPKEYYKPYVEVEISRLRYKIFHPTKFWEKSPVQEMVKKLKPNKQAIVSNIEIVKKTKQAPAGLNTVALLRVASSFLKMSPMEALNKAEKLYSMGYTTYPRTETTKYASGFDFMKILNEFSNHKQFGPMASKLCKNFCKPNRGNDAGDHPPITPTTKVAIKEDLNGDLWRLYEFICNHFMASLCEAAQYEEKIYTITVDKENFTQDSMDISYEGFLALMSWKRSNYVKNFPNLTMNQVLKIDNVSYEMRETEPPEYLSESDLIKMMEQNRIGTDASMPTHIENISERKYVNVNSSRRLIPTKLGIALIEALMTVDSELVLPTVRANIEKNVEEIAKGNKSYEEVLRYTIDLFKNKFGVTRKNYDKLVSIFKKYFSIDQNLLFKNISNINLKNKQFTSSKTKPVDVSKITTDIKPCNYCNKGKIWIDYDSVDKIILRCTSCNIRKKVLRDTTEYKITRELQCDNCKAYYIFVTVENPFANGDKTYHGCMFCDPNLS